MNTKRVLKELGRVAECNPFQMFRPQLVIVLAFFAFGIIAAEGSDSMLPATHPTLDHVKPVNWPTYETHRDEASKVCHGRVLEPSKKTPSPWVIVVKNNGDVVKMATQEAWDRSNDKNEFNHVWTIGVCKKHVEKN